MKHDKRFIVSGTDRMIGSIGIMEEFTESVWAKDEEQARETTRDYRAMAGRDHVLCKEVKQIDSKAAMMERIERHGRQLLAIFPNAKQSDPIKLCKALRRLESDTHSYATAWCNGDIDSEAWERLSGKVLAKVAKMLNAISDGPPIRANGDARGYALKIDSDNMDGIDLHRDWGGNGIIAPDLTEA